MTCRDNEDAYDAKTYVQFQTYTRELVGKSYFFSGKVYEVYTNGKISLFDNCRKVFTDIYLHTNSQETILSLNKDQFIQGIGKIRGVIRRIYGSRNQY